MWMSFIEQANKVCDVPYSQIQVGTKAVYTKTITNEDVLEFAKVTGDINPIHVDDEFAKTTMFKERIAHGLLTAGFISTLIGTKLPGKNTLYLSQDVKFKAPVKIGDTLTVVGEVIEKRDDKQILKMTTHIYNQFEKMVLEGTAVVMKM